jgi:threonine dehydrogenase-like Zn-dependent dehydrogenase
MKITVFGSGYVGLATGACLADAGNHVLCVDVDEHKIEMLKRGELPIHEPGLEVVVKRNFDAKRLRFTTNSIWSPLRFDHGFPSWQKMPYGEKCPDVWFGALGLPTLFVLEGGYAVNVLQEFA